MDDTLISPKNLPCNAVQLETFNINTKGRYLRFVANTTELYAALNYLHIDFQVVQGGETVLCPGKRFIQRLGVLKKYYLYHFFTVVSDKSPYPNGVFEYTWLLFADECETYQPRANFWIGQITSSYGFITFDLKDWGFVTQIHIKNSNNAANHNV